MRHPTRDPRYVRLTLILTGLFILAAAAALAQRPGPGMKGDSDALGPCPGLLAERLELSEEQIAQIDRIREESREKAVDLRKQLMRVRNDLKGEMLADSPSHKKVMELNGRLGELRTGLAAIRLEHKLAVRELLTPEQRDRMLLMGERDTRGRGGRPGAHAGGLRHGPRGAAGAPDGPRAARQDCPRIED